MTKPKMTCVAAAFALLIAIPTANASTCGYTMEPVQYTPVPQGTPANIAAFHGKWGEAKWNNFLCSVLFVRSVAPDGKAEVIYVWGVYEQWDIFKPGHIEAVGKIEGNRLSFKNTRGTDIQYTLEDGKLKGVFGGNARITMSKAAN